MLDVRRVKTSSQETECVHFFHRGAHMGPGDLKAARGKRHSEHSGNSSDIPLEALVVQFAAGRIFPFLSARPRLFLRCPVIPPVHHIQMDGAAYKVKIHAKQPVMYQNTSSWSTNKFLNILLLFTVSTKVP